MSDASIPQEERIRQAAHQLFLEAKHVNELTIEKILGLADSPSGRGAFRRVFPGNEFVDLRQTWVRQHIEHAITTIFATAQAPRDVTLQRIASLAGCDISTVKKHAGSHIAARRKALSDEKILQAIEHLVEARIAPHEYTQERICREAGIFARLRGDLLRAFYELPSIAALQAQLGHNNPKTTLAYAQHDRFEHPAQVNHALDAFGRKVLVRWQTPIMIDDLSDAERLALLNVRNAHEQEVGICRQKCCVKLNGDHLPPCSLCEHLVSGPEYLPFWERENVFRRQQLERLAQTSKAELQLAQMKGQYDRFLANYRYVQERSHQ